MPSIIGSKLREVARAWLLPIIRSSLENPQTPLSYPAEWLLDIFNGGRTDSGIRVSEMTALQVTTVFACVELVSSTIGALPLQVFEMLTAADKRRAHLVAFDHDAYDLLRYEPNEEMTAFTFRKTLQAHMLLWGNGYAEIQRDQGNRVVALWPRNPARTRPYRNADGVLIYKTTEGMDQQSNFEIETPTLPERVISSDDMIHIPGLSLDGRLGQSVVQLARQAIGLSLATEKYGSKYFGNGARPGGVLEHPGKLTPQSRENLKRSWTEAQGGENAHRVAVLEEGMKWQEAANKPEEAQFLETRQFQKGEVCSIFRVPPHMVGDSEHSNRANTEQIGLEFLSYTIGPWLERWEQEMRRKLFPSLGRAAGRFFPKFVTRSLVMPDSESRRNFYASGKQWGYLSTNDIRQFEDLNPVDDPAADAYWMPVNMTEMGSAPANPNPPAPDGSPALASAPDADEPTPTPVDAPAAPTTGKESNAFAPIIRAFSPIFQDAIRRILTRERPDFETFRRAFEPILCGLAAQIADQYGQETWALSAAFVADYARSLGDHLPLWRAAGDGLLNIAEEELRRAIAGIWEEVSRLRPMLSV